MFRFLSNIVVVELRCQSANERGEASEGKDGWMEGARSVHVLLLGCIFGTPAVSANARRQNVGLLGSETPAALDPVTHPDAQI